MDQEGGWHLCNNSLLFSGSETSCCQPVAFNQVGFDAALGEKKDDTLKVYLLTSCFKDSSGVMGMRVLPGQERIGFCEVEELWVVPRPHSCLLLWYCPGKLHSSRN